MLDDNTPVGLTFDDVVLVPARSNVLPNEVDTRTLVTRTVRVHIPIISAAMDTVTEARLAIAMAREGGIGIVHRVLSPADQAAEVDRVKKSESGMILDPVTISPDQTIRDAHELMTRYRISGIPVTKHGKLVGKGDPTELHGDSGYERHQIQPPAGQEAGRGGEGDDLHRRHGHVP